MSATISMTAVSKAIRRRRRPLSVYGRERDAICSIICIRFIWRKHPSMGDTRTQARMRLSSNNKMLHTNTNQQTLSLFHISVYHKYTWESVLTITCRRSNIHTHTHTEQHQNMVLKKVGVVSPLGTETILRIQNSGNTNQAAGTNNR